ncbi:fatty acid synthase [Lasius niger]|uniref:Fatty acid synthase n=1 Tax=Lasius niger TaxID=67767 RepID=A0A0J7K0Z9_LASNI|nr:fatty acid synthase [Lasius niger]
MVETVANILNVKDLKKISQNTSLAELGMDSMMVVEIKQTLEREFDIFFTVQELRNLTFKKLIELSNANTDSDNTQARKSLDTRKPEVTKLFGIVKDEDFMTEICLDFSTKRKENTAQCTTNNIDAMNTISETINYLLKHVSSRLKDGKDFVMVGYSFGSIVAIELARRLEAMNFEGRLVLIDGAPEQVRIMNEYYIPSSSDVEHQIDILITIMETYNVGTNEKV